MPPIAVRRKHFYEAVIRALNSHRLPQRGGEPRRSGGAWTRAADEDQLESCDITDNR